LVESARHETDATADPYLHAAILLGLGLATRGKAVGKLDPFANKRTRQAARGWQGTLIQPLDRL